MMTAAFIGDFTQDLENKAFAETTIIHARDSVKKI